MVKKIFLLLLAIGVLAGGVYWFIESRNEEAKIRRTLKNLCETASKPMGERAAAGMLKLQRLDKFVAPKFRLNVNHGMLDGEMTPAELSANIARYRPMVRWLTISMQNTEITVSEDGKTANVSFTGTLLAVTKKTGSRVNEVRDLCAVLQKTDFGWLVTELAINDILEK